jgi:vacuolar-type H+-ATPase subunit E/Vma4
MAHAEKKQGKKVHRDDGDPKEHMSALVSGIQQDMSKEAETMLSDSKKEAERRKLYARKQAESILNDAREKAESQAEKIRIHTLAGVNLEAKRRSLRVLDALYDEVVEKARVRMKAAIEEKGYERILLDLIVEAAIGLDAPAALVNASQREREIISRKLLDQAQKVVKTFTGKNVRLMLSDDTPLLGQGIILKSEDGRIAYNNQIETRMKRMASEIRKAIHNRLSGIMEDGASGTRSADKTDRGDEE